MRQWPITVALKEPAAGDVVLDDVAVEQLGPGVPLPHFLEQASSQTLTAILRIDHEVEDVDDRSSRTGQPDGLPSNRDGCGRAGAPINYQNIAFLVQTSPLPVIVTLVIEAELLSLRTAPCQSTESGIVSVWFG